MTASGPWYRFSNADTDPTVAEIHIIDMIGDWYDDAANRFWGENIGVTARSFVEQLSKLPADTKTVRVHINSPGGDIQAGINIANALREQASKGRTVETVIDGIAASIASVIAMAGTRVVMADNALLMVHNPWTIGVGNAAEMRKTADVLDAMRNQIVATYQWHSPLDADALIALMDAETWMGPDEALAAGLITEKSTGVKAVASLSRAAIAKLTAPAAFQARLDALVKPEPTPAPAPAFDALPIVAACRAAGLADLAEELVSAKAPMAAVTARLEQEQTARAAAAQRATDIHALCALGTLPELADSYIAGGMPLDAIRAQLTVMAAKLDTAEIDSSLPVDGKGARPVGATVALQSLQDSYRKLNGRKE